MCIITYIDVLYVCACIYDRAEIDHMKDSLKNQVDHIPITMSRFFKFILAWGLNHL